ncbi:hypothetical protein HPB52_000651 [Rhipicephalus sanguineus]|uniref:Uncharacterized protein n=1 Tax=Rhipicephalus sanguineus TaxID=34632 RepID=A0A9D4Q938_RHISA|nr:hypothetical protein HPB52_000651 [Rhipicephalus sanguineus]
MVASDHQPTETVESAAGEDWVSLQDGGDGVSELLNKDNDGHAKGEKESIPSAVEGQESGRVARWLLRWCRAAWNDVLFGDFFWDNARAYVLGGALCVNAALHMLGVLATLAEYNALRILLTCSEHFTMAILCPAAFSFVTRFLSLLAAKASFVKKLEVNVLLFSLLVINVVVLLASCFACIYEVRAGIMLFPEAHRQKYFRWYLKWLADMTRMQALVVAAALAPSLVVLTGSDVGATFLAFRLHWQGTAEARNAFTGRCLRDLKRDLSGFAEFAPILLCICLPVIFTMLGKDGRKPAVPPPSSPSGTHVGGPASDLGVAEKTDPPEIACPFHEGQRSVADKSRSPLGRRDGEVMAASDHRQTQVVQSPANEKWVFLQDDGDAAKEQLLEEQDGDARGEKEDVSNAVQGQESGQATGKFLWCCRCAWNDASVRNALWDDMRPYVLGAVLSMNTVLHVLAALASLTECGTMQALFNSLKHFTTTMLCAAVSSMATRFLSLSAVKASEVKNTRVSLLSDLAVTNIEILLVTCIACVYEVRAGIMVFQAVRQEEDFSWFFQLLADMARVQALTLAVVLAASLVVRMGIDVRATIRAMLHRRRQNMEETWKQAAGQTLDRAQSTYRRPSILHPFVDTSMVIFEAAVYWILGLMWLRLPGITAKFEVQPPQKSSAKYQ